MEHTKGKLAIRVSVPDLGSNERHAVDIIFADNGARVAGIDEDWPTPEYTYHAKLIVAAVNACQEVNADNPIAVAESIKEMYDALKLVAEWQNGHFGPNAEPRPMLPVGFNRQQVIDKLENALAKAERK